MQRIYPSPCTVEEYIATNGHRLIVPDSTCPACHQATALHWHARYERWVAAKSKYLLIWVARFLCSLCKKTISYLPDFVPTYRPIPWDTFEAFIEGELERADVRRHLDRLRQYRRQAESFCAELFRTVGAGLGRPPPRTARGLWGWLKKAGEGLRSVTRQLVTNFRITIFKRYRCHQPASP